MAEAVIEINKFDRGLPIPPRDLLLIDPQLPCARLILSTCLKVLLPSSQQFANVALRVMGLPSDCSSSAAVGATIHDNQ